MQETLLALCAILIFSFFALRHHSAKADVEEFAVTSEVEIAAARVARQRLSTVLAMEFDEADVGHSRARASTTGLSALGTDDAELVEADFDDVDDFHGQPMRIVSSEWIGQSISFTDSVWVTYIDPATLQPAGSASDRTLIKEINVVVRAQPDGFIGTPPIAATLSQIVTPSN